MEDEKVVISSLVVEVRPESVDAVARALAAMEGGGARGERVQDRRHHRGFLHRRLARGFEPVHSDSRVLNVNLVYVNFEDETLRVESRPKAELRGTLIRSDSPRSANSPHWAVSFAQNSLVKAPRISFDHCLGWEE